MMKKLNDEEPEQVCGGFEEDYYIGDGGYMNGQGFDDNNERRNVVDPDEFLRQFIEENKSW